MWEWVWIWEWLINVKLKLRWSWKLFDFENGKLIPKLKYQIEV